MITVIGYILTTLGFGGLAYSLFTVNTNKRYSWTSPFSSFEKTIIAVAIIYYSACRNYYGYIFFC